MATIEFINKRIEGKKKEIEKLSKKLERIEKAKATNWEKNPYYYRESDLKYTLRDLEEAKASLANYEADLEVALHKANSRNIQVIIDFLDGWKDRAFKFYQDSLPRYIEARTRYYEADHRLCDWHNGRYAHIKEIGEEEYKRIEKELHEEYKIEREAFRSNWSWLSPYILYNDVLDEEKVKKDLQIEADRKYDFIIERTQKIVTEITDASYLRIGEAGELNGYIIGTTGKAKVESVYAGGWNIQCLHIRTLIHEIKK